ncbi:hypothetical protein NUW58_g10652 [Xylaria curta]|uniref:Uncharacterized protein n=1 Tax=Xylaria curta TaxID=42375 RepID=A0ACC1MJN4_9PEZI|nr:hypothetical protein NUW58_g10652 [Xylaria curta]
MRRRGIVVVVVVVVFSIYTPLDQAATVAHEHTRPEAERETKNDGQSVWANDRNGKPVARILRPRLRCSRWYRTFLAALILFFVFLFTYAVSTGGVPFPTLPPIRLPSLSRRAPPILTPDSLVIEEVQEVQDIRLHKELPALPPPETKRPPPPADTEAALESLLIES